MQLDLDGREHAPQAPAPAPCAPDPLFCAPQGIRGQMPLQAPADVAPLVLELVPIHPEGEPDAPANAPVLLGWVAILGDLVSIDFGSPAEAEACVRFYA